MVVTRIILDLTCYLHFHFISSHFSVLSLCHISPISIPLTLIFALFQLLRILTYCFPFCKSLSILSMHFVCQWITLPVTPKKVEQCSFLSGILTQPLTAEHWDSSLISSNFSLEFTLKWNYSHFQFPFNYSLCCPPIQTQFT